MIISDSQLKKLLIAKSILDEKEADDLMQLAFHTNVSFVQLLIDKDIISDSNLGLIISDFLHFPFIILSKTRNFSHLKGFW